MSSRGHAEREWLASCARGLAPLLQRELAELGGEDLREQGGGVSFRGSRAVLYRSCLWSRLASRLFLPLASGAAGDADALYALLRGIDWSALMRDGASIAVDFHGSNAAIRDGRFGAQRSKDAIVDSLREAGRERPRVDIKGADLRVSVRLQGERADVALDMVGDSLHRRGYRVGSGAAPMKENLAAAVLLRADWPSMAASGGALIDPLCGSGTLLIEAAWIAADCAPALKRERFAFEAWAGHDATQWQAIHSEAKGRAQRGLAGDLPEIRGYDEDLRVIRRAQENIAAAGLTRQVRVSAKSLRELKRPTHRPLPRGLVACNPPYGQRLGSDTAVLPLYRQLGELLHREFSGWQAAMLAGDREQGRATGLRSHRQYQLYNGRLPVTLLLFDMDGNRLREASALSGGAADAEPVPAETEAPLSAGASMFANRLRKNQRRLQRWLRRSAEECYRLYDADMPEYAVAVDRYGEWLHVAEYRAPASVDAQAAAQRLQQVMEALPEATGVSSQRIVLKQRERQRGSAQYQRQAARDEFLSVREGAGESAGESARLPRYGPVPRSPRPASTTGERGPGQAFPESVLLYRSGDGPGCPGWGPDNDQRGSVEHLSRLAATQSRAQWSRGIAPSICPG